MRIFEKFYRSLVRLLKSLQQAVINGIEKGIIIFRDHHLPPALTGSVNLMSETWFYFKLKFLAEMLKRLR